MKILMIGDVMGEPGRRAIASCLPRLVATEEVDLVIANGENAAGGKGITPKIAEELFDLGVHIITGGNHLWDKREIVGILAREPRILRPVNYPDGAAGEVRAVVVTAKGEKAGVLHFVGRVFMQPVDCPFRAATREVEKLRAETPVIIVDMHGEATSEKVAMGWHLDGLASAVLGTHTHVQTADERILPQGTAYITDVGMTGPDMGIIGMRREEVLERFLTQTPRRFEVATGPWRFQAGLVEVDASTGRARAIRRVHIREDDAQD